ncbi:MULTISPECIES: histidine kinase [unclassified Nocardia]|uniref:sensor histidine kinase n=1 Tax=unclassified Nocardia TaxID=2637762 RepID=UPI001CE41F5D|nr:MULTISPECIES: histidine kinase [unclassified Nocardia]
MRRFSLWLREKPMITDALLALVVFLFDLVAMGDSKQKAVYLVTGLMLVVPLVFRRTYPRATAIALLALSMVVACVGYLFDIRGVQHPALIALGIALYTLVAYVGRREGLWYLLGLILAYVAAYGLVSVPDGGMDIFVTALLYALCWTLAEFVGARHAYDAEVAARLAVADYDRERRAHDAVAAERTRIARELHDVVAHAVSVIIVQADGARYALRQNPDAAEQALATIAGTGREALRELRRTVALLRTEHAPDQLPQHGTAGLAKVVEMMRGTGLAVELEMTGQLDEIPPEVSLGVHRIVQESLTNTLRHAGDHPMAWVRVWRRDNEVRIEVVDSGGVPMRALANGDRIQGSGLGLVGMRERIAVLGGNMEAGRCPDGAWKVTATIPLAPENRE